MHSHQQPARKGLARPDSRGGLDVAHPRVPGLDLTFVHQFRPVFNEAALLDDPETLTAVTAINHQISDLALVLNSPTISPGVKVVAATPPAQDAVPPRIDTMLKRGSGGLFLFTVSMRDEPAHVALTFPGPIRDGQAEVLGEKRRVALTNGALSDDFEPYGVHLYALKPEVP